MSVCHGPKQSDTIQRVSTLIESPTDVQSVVQTADGYASEVMDMLVLLEGDDLHEALSGAFLLFLADVAEVVS